MTERVGKVIIPAKANPWPHEERVARILAKNGHVVEFIPEASSKTPDIYLDGVFFEIKSPFSGRPCSIEQNIRRALIQSNNIIIDISRIKKIDEKSLRSFLSRKVKQQKQIGRLLLITKNGNIIDF